MINNKETVEVHAITINEFYRDLYKNFAAYGEQEKMSKQEYADFINGIVVEAYPYVKPYMDRGEDWWNYDNAYMASCQCKCPVVIVELNQFINRVRETLGRKSFDIDEIQLEEDRRKVLAEMDIAVSKRGGYIKHTRFDIVKKNTPDMEL